MRRWVVRVTAARYRADAAEAVAVSGCHRDPRAGHPTLTPRRTQITLRATRGSRHGPRTFIAWAILVVVGGGGVGWWRSAVAHALNPVSTVMQRRSDAADAGHTQQRKECT
jgi:hypothetical protein